MLIKLIGIAVLMAASTVAGALAAMFHIVMFVIRAIHNEHPPSRRQRSAYSAHLTRVEEGLMRR